jgi:hypothetical protein
LVCNQQVSKRLDQAALLRAIAPAKALFAIRSWRRFAGAFLLSQCVLLAGMPWRGKDRGPVSSASEHTRLSADELGLVRFAPWRLEQFSCGRGADPSKSN